MKIDFELLKRILANVEKPARYTGGEYNTPDMLKPRDFHMCMCFPDIYEVGMSNLGIKILYHMLNDRHDTVCERAFMPWTDMCKELENHKIPLFSLETRTVLKDFDAVGISVQYELAYTNIVHMLRLAGIPYKAARRDERYPLLIAGGPCMANPEPFAELFDIMVVGEGEEIMNILADKIIAAKKERTPRKELLESLIGIDGIIIPSVHNPQSDKCLSVKKAFVKDFENAYAPAKVLVPNIETVHDRAVLELYRGCPNGCKYCQAGFYYRPIRFRSVDKLLKIAQDSIGSTGYNEISLSSLSTGDYPHIKELITKLKENFKDSHVNINLPSLRVDSFESFHVSEARKSSLTFAPEAGTDRLRKVINKRITEEDIIKSITSAYKIGYSGVKLYFMIGLPTETQEDIEGIVTLVKKIKDLYIENRTSGKELRLSVSASVFVPKPCTPFEREAMLCKETVVERIKYLRNGLKMKNVTFHWHEPDMSVLETVFARGGRELCEVIIRAAELGCMFDGWNEKFNAAIWRQAFIDSNISADNYLGKISDSAALPYGYIKC